MCQTLFFLPHRLWGLPLFGFGLLLAAWGMASLVWIGWILWKAGFKKAVWLPEVLERLPFVGLVGIVISVLFPRLEVAASDGELLGLPIRGYGAFLLAGVVAGWWLSSRRALQSGFSVDTLAALGLYLFVAGIVGARLFFVVEYWDSFVRPSWRETLLEVAKFTEGGLVVYGSLIGGFLALSWFAWRRSLSVIAIADLIAPGVVLGMAIGRIGCLMNGCCYGGLSEPGAWGIQFPRFNSTVQQLLSPPYLHQLRVGRLHGFSLPKNESDQPIVRFVDPNGPAGRSGLTAGARLARINGVATPTIAAAGRVLEGADADLEVELADGQRLRWSIGSLPPRSLPVHPSQIYSAISGLLICFVLLSSEPYWNRPGAVLALLLTVYPVVRFLEEVIRDDEPGQLGTGLTISQLVSLLVFTAGLATWIYVFFRARGADAQRPLSLVSR